MIETKNNIETKLDILAFLFKECNNNCQFCFQKNYGDVIGSINFFNENIEQYLDCFRKALSDYKDFDKVTVGLLGGEPFFEDKTTENILRIIDLIGTYEDIRIKIGSNLLNTNLQKIDRCLQCCYKNKINTTFNASFDFGNTRFSSLQAKENFKQNFYKVKEICEKYNCDFGLEVIRTKKMLESYQNEDDDFKFIKDVSEKVEVNLGVLTGNDNLQLSYRESIELWILSLLKTPHIKELSIQFNTHENYRPWLVCFGSRARTIMGGCVFEGCYAQKIGPKKITEEESEEEKKCLINKMITQYGCYNCVYFNRCSFGCAYEHYYDKCDKKEVFKFIDENGIEFK